MVDPDTDYALQFFYPTYASPTAIATLRPPEMGDAETKDLRQVHAETGGGTKIVFTRGPPLFYLSFEFTHVPRVARDLFATWFSDSVEGAKNTFELRRPKYHDLDIAELPLGAFLYQGCEFDDGELAWPETARRGFYGLSLPRIRATSRVDVA